MKIIDGLQESSEIREVVQIPFNFILLNAQIYFTNTHNQNNK